MNHVKQLAGQTIIYGTGIVLPRVLNYLLLTPFYTRIFSREQYGMITELYAYVVFLMVILTYGLETGLFRFADKDDNKDQVYKTSLISVTVTSLSFIAICLLFSVKIAGFLDYADHPEFISLLAIIVGLDTLTAIPFAKIRLDNRPVKYAWIRIIEVLVNIGANWFLLYWCPDHAAKYEWVSNIYNPEFGVGYVLVSNLLATGIKTLLLSSEIFRLRGKFNFAIWKQIMNYSLPLLVAGLAGTINEAIDRVMLKHLTPAQDMPLEQLGIYGANYKLAVMMTLFIQMFRYAAEPFFFSKKNESNAKQIYADVMRYFVFAGMLIFLLVMMYIDVFKLFIGKEFRDGINIVPIVLLANLFVGIFFNQSIWYKLQNLTRYGAGLVITGAIITFLINFFFIPEYGYYASAWGHFVSYLVMIVLSWIIGRRYYNIPYDIKNILLYIFVGIGVYLLFRQINFSSVVFEYCIKGVSLSVLIAGFLISEKRKSKRVR